MGAAFPGELEQMILLAVLRLETEAYALAIIRELDREVGRSVSRGALYTTLDRMVSKGYVTWETEETTPERGGHPRRLFSVTPVTRLLVALLARALALRRASLARALRMRL